jgi:hypothetical protein
LHSNKTQKENTASYNKNITETQKCTERKKNAKRFEISLLWTITEAFRSAKILKNEFRRIKLEAQELF